MNKELAAKERRRLEAQREFINGLYDEFNDLLSDYCQRNGTPSPRVNRVIERFVQDLLLEKSSTSDLIRYFED